MALLSLKNSHLTLKIEILFVKVKIYIMTRFIELNEHFRCTYDILSPCNNNRKKEKLKVTGMKKKINLQLTLFKTVLI